MNDLWSLGVTVTTAGSVASIYAWRHEILLKIPQSKSYAKQIFISIHGFEA
jgi:hypothetical protein